MGVFDAFAGCLRVGCGIWPRECWMEGVKTSFGKVPRVNLKRLGERRKWPRLPLAIPVFVRSRDDKGKEVLEFATALNVSAGGMLLAVRRAQLADSVISLEIPSAPLATLALLPRASRYLRARSLRSSTANGYQLLGLKFSRPLVSPRESVTPAVRVRRKVSSVV